MSLQHGKPTISDIKYSSNLGEYFFSRQTLRFFGQTMSSFKVYTIDKDAQIYSIEANGKHGLITQRTLKRLSIEEQKVKGYVFEEVKQ
jgi:stage III sporulation protein SpoIIIAA